MSKQPIPCEPETGIRFQLIQSEEGFRALEPEWEALRSTSRPHNPYLAFPWLSACWEGIRHSAELFVLTARVGERLVGVAPLRRERAGGMRRLCFLGKGPTPYVAFLTSPELPALETELLGALDRYGAQWDLLRFDQLAEPFTALASETGPSPLWTHSEPCPWKGAAYVRFDGDWEGLRASGLSWLREAGRRLRKFERDGGTVERLVGAAAAAHAEEVAEIEARSWKGQYGQAHSASERRRLSDFLERAYAGLGDEMDLWLARMEGELVAYRINILSAERIWLYRASYDDRFARYSIGSALDYACLQHAWAEGRREFDYLSGGEPYKAHRTSAVRPLMRLTASPRTLRGTVSFALFGAPQTLLNRNPKTREWLQFLSRVRKSPRSLLPGSGVVASRVHH